METNKGLFEAQTPNKALTEPNLLQFIEIQRWLDKKKSSTQKVYLHALTAFMEHTKLDPKELIDLAEEDIKKNQRERGEPARKIQSFYRWLTTDYVKKTHGIPKTVRAKQPLSSNLANTYANAIKSFFKDNNFPVYVKIPKPLAKKENFTSQPPRRYLIGESEKHDVYVQTTFWMGKVKVDVDGRRIVDSRSWGINSDFRFPVGEKEKHEIMVKVTVTNAFEVYVDGKFYAKT
jgi:hypothetical protein